MIKARNSYFHNTNTCYSSPPKPPIRPPPTHTHKTISKLIIRKRRMEPKEKCTIFVSVHLNLMTIIIPATAPLRSVWFLIPSTVPSMTDSTFWFPSEASPSSRVQDRPHACRPHRRHYLILQNTIHEATISAFPWCPDLNLNMQFITFPARHSNHATGPTGNDRARGEETAILHSQLSI